MLWVKELAPAMRHSAIVKRIVLVKAIARATQRVIANVKSRNTTHE